MLLWFRVCLYPNQSVVPLTSSPRSVRFVQRFWTWSLVLATERFGSQIEQAANDASLVLLGADLAAQLPVAALDRLLSAVSPAVVVVPDVRGQAELPDLANRLRQQLGVFE